MLPSVAGYCSSTPQTSLPNSRLPSSTTSTWRPMPSARVWQTAMVWGWQLEDTRKRGFLPRATALHRMGEVGVGGGGWGVGWQLEEARKRGFLLRATALHGAVEEVGVVGGWMGARKRGLVAGRCWGGVAVELCVG